MPKCGPQAEGNYTSLSHLQRAVASVERTLKSLHSPSAQGPGEDGLSLLRVPSEKGSREKPRKPQGRAERELSVQKYTLPVMEEDINIEACPES